jgi:hypothetical protein
MLDNIDFSKYVDGLVPAVIQDIETSKVLMLGFMPLKPPFQPKKSLFIVGQKIDFGLREKRVVTF